VDVGRAALITAGAAAATFAVDRALKVAVEHTLDEGEHTRGPLGIRIVRRTNDRGIGGSARDAHPDGLLMAAGGALALGVAGAGAWLGRRGGLANVGLMAGAGLVAGGMAGNLFDRASEGRVTDFLPSPLGVLNAADLAIGAGIVLGGLGMALR
jgi:lipoprotein signal peptidase